VSESGRREPAPDERHQPSLIGGFRAANRRLEQFYGNPDRSSGLGCSVRVPSQRNPRTERGLVIGYGATRGSLGRLVRQDDPARRCM